MSQEPEQRPSAWQSYSAPVGLAVLVVAAAALAWNDSRSVNAVNASYATVRAARDCVATFAATAPEEAALRALRGELEGVVSSEGRAQATPLFELLGREEIQRGARTNVAMALALLARLELLEGDLEGAAQAAQRYERETEDDLVPAEVEAWVWRVNELVVHPRAREVDRAGLRAALFAERRLTEVWPGAPKTD